jgi:hypothetical protein
MLTGRATAAGILAALMAVAPTASAAPWRTPPTAGSHLYRYEVQETGAGPAGGYRTDFRLRADGKGGYWAEIIRSATYDGKAWTPVAVDAACAKAMNARPGELARVKLTPLSADAMALGDAFLDRCAPDGVFFPLTDILNVAIIVGGQALGGAALKAPGDTAPAPALNAVVQRADVQLTETAPSVEAAFVSLEDGRASVDWKPGPAALDLTRQIGGQPLHLKGVEHFAFRATVDARTGVLEEAHTLYDDLDLAIVAPGGAQAPRLALHRAATITLLPADGA